jgi:hypothetical protein
MMKQLEPHSNLKLIFFFFAVFIFNTGFAQSDSAAVVNAKWQVIKVAPGIILEHCWFDSSLFHSNQNISILKVKLNHKNRADIGFSFWSADGKPISAEEFMQNLFGTLPDFFKNEEELRTILGNPITRKQFLEKLEEVDFGKDELATLQKLVNGENSHLFDVLEYVFNSKYKLISREQRVANAQHNIFALLNTNEKEFLEFVLSKYIECGVEELDQEKLPDLLKLKYQAISDAEEKLGGVANIRDRFIGFQKWLYEGRVA